jgi:molybdopterin converting factor small subunit
MRVRVRLAAGLARLAGAPLLALTLEPQATVDDLLQALGDAHPDLAPALAAVLPVIAGAHAQRGDVLQDGDEVALLLPVAGG